MGKRRIKKHMFRIDVPTGTAPEMFAMMFGTQIKGIHVALSRLSDTTIVISSPRESKLLVRKLARKFGVEAQRAYRDVWGKERTEWMAGDYNGSRSKFRGA